MVFLVVKMVQKNGGEVDMDVVFWRNSGTNFKLSQVEFWKHVSFRSDARHDPKATFLSTTRKNTNLPHLIEDPLCGTYLSPIHCCL